MNPEHLHKAAVLQLNTIPDPDVSECWQMLIETIRIIGEGYGNTGGKITEADLQRFIEMICNGIEWSPEEMGEDLLYMTLLPGNRLEVQLVAIKETCDARLMLAELEKLAAAITRLQ